MFYFNDLVRWQLWFDNPNKCAVLFAELVIVGITLLKHRNKLVAICGVVLAVFMSYALLRTFSRGGMVALAVAGIPIAIKMRMWLWSNRIRIGVFIVMSVVLLLAAVKMGFAERITVGLTGNDASVRNRLELWSKVPQMMHDAPVGWGHGNSGKTYMQWYQPLDRTEKYRTMVNSHLTWMVEYGVGGVVLWTLFWTLILLIGWGVGRDRGNWICLSEWLILFVSGMFSSVLESWELWVIPILSMQMPICPNWRKPCKAIMFAVGIAVICFVIGVLVLPAGKVRMKGDYIEVGGKPFAFWLLPDAEVLGGDSYPREIREYIDGGTDISFVIAASPDCVPVGAQVVVLSGKWAASKVRGACKTIWLSPKGFWPEIGVNDVCIIGAFSKWTTTHEENRNCVIVDGACDYIPNWVRMVCEIGFHDSLMTNN